MLPVRPWACGTATSRCGWSVGAACPTLSATLWAQRMSRLVHGPPRVCAFAVGRRPHAVPSSRGCTADSVRRGCDAPRSLHSRIPHRRGGTGVGRARAIVKRVWLSLGVLAMIGFASGALVMFGWMVDETHFDRPSQEFDDSRRRSRTSPASTASRRSAGSKRRRSRTRRRGCPSRSIEAGLPGLLAAACSTDYPDAVTWSIRVRTPAEAEVSLYAAPTTANIDGAGARCPDFGFDAVRLVDELDRVAPGLAIQPTIWDNGRLALVALEERDPDRVHPPSAACRARRRSARRRRSRCERRRGDQLGESRLCPEAGRK